MDGDAVQDYELGQVCIRQFTGWPTTVPIDPAFAEHVGHVMRPVLAKAADDVMAAWEAIPPRTRQAVMECAPCIHGPGTSCCGHPDCVGERGGR